jgi:hypothetical protein
MPNNYINFDRESPAQQTLLGANSKLQQKRLLAQLLLQQGMESEPTGHWSNALPKAANQIMGALLARQSGDEMKTLTDKYQTDYAAMLEGGRPQTWTNPDTGVAKDYGGLEGMIEKGLASGNPYLLPQIQELQMEQYKTDTALKKLKAMEDYKANQLLSPEKEEQQIRINQARRPYLSIDLAGQSGFAKKFGTEQASLLMKSQASAQKAVEEIRSIHEMRDAMASGMYQGGGADLKANVFNWLKGFGFNVDDATLANTGKFKSAVGKFVLNHAKELGSNPSNTDAKRIEQIVGTIDTDPGAMQAIMDFMEESARRSIALFNSRYGQVKQNPDVFSAYDMSVEEPGAWKPKGAGTSQGSTPSKGTDDINPTIPGVGKVLKLGEKDGLTFYSDSKGDQYTILPNGDVHKVKPNEQIKF